MSTLSSKKRFLPRFSPQFIKRLSSWLVLSTALTLAVRSASSLYWDADGNPAGNDIEGTGLGGGGTWDTTSGSWWDGVSANSTWNNAQLNTAIFTGPAGTVTLAEPITAGRLVFNTSGYVIGNGGVAANTLEMAGPATVEVKNFEQRAEIAAVVTGSAGFTKSGNGTLALKNSANSYSGDTVINSGRLIVSDQAQLGTSTTTVSVNGLAGFGYTGGTLMLDGGMSGMTFDRDISVAGRGANVVSASFITAGNNVINGDFTTSYVTESRLVSLYGTTTLNGQITLGSGQTSLFLGNGNWVLNGQVTSTATNTGALYKTGNSVSTTLVLANANNNFQQQVRIDSGTIRVAHGGALGTNTSTASVRGSGGTLEIRAAAADVGTFGGVNLLMDGSFIVVVDRAIGGYNAPLNQTVTLGEFRFNGANRTLTVNNRNGYNLVLGKDPTLNMGGNGNANIAFTNNSDGFTTLQGTVQVGDSGAARTFTINTAGNMTFNGRINSNGTGFDHHFTKSGSGELIMGSGSAFFDANGSSNYAGNTSVTDGTLTLRTIRAVNEAGGQLFLSNGALNFIGDEGTGAGEVWTKTINFNSTQPIILANQTGSAPTALVIASDFTANNTAAKNLYLGGESTLDNTISGVILNNAGTTAVQKSGRGTWVLSGDNGAAANGFTGALTISGGTLKIADTFTDASRNVVKDTSAVIFNVDALRRDQSAGGVFEYVGAAGANSVENVGSLSYSAGSSTVKLTPGSLGTASLNFTNINTTGAATVNFVGGDFTNNTFTIPTVNGTAGSNGLLTRSVYWEGADFAYRQSGVLRAPVYGTDAGFVTSDTALAAGNNEITGSFTTAGSISVSTLKINGGHTLTLDPADTVTLSLGGLLATGGASTITGGTALALGTQTLVARVNEAADSLAIETVITGSGGLTKSGLGTLILSGENNQTGTVGINEGTVRLSGAGRLSADNMTLNIRQDGVLDLNGSAAGVAVGVFNGAGRVTNSGAASTTLSIGNGLTTNGLAGTFSGVLEDGLGRLAVSLTTANDNPAQTTTFVFSGLNTYTGATTLAKATSGNLVLQVNNLADIGAASGIGAGDATDDATNAASLTLNGATLQYVGATTAIYDIDGARSVSTNRLFTLAGDGTIDSSPSYGNETAFSTIGTNHASLIFRNTGAVAFSGAGARNLTLQGNSQGDNLMNLRLVDNGVDPLSVTKSGTGLWILGNNANTYTGTTTISGGALQAQDGTNLPTASNLTITGGVFQTSGTFNRTLGAGPGQLQLTGGSSGFAASTAPLTVTLDGGAPLVWGSAFFAPTTLVLGSTTALFSVELTNDIDLADSTRTVQVDLNSTTGLDFAVLSGDLSSATATTGLTKSGNGTLYLLGANTYTGDTSVTAGAVFVEKFGGSTGASNLGTGGALNLGNGTATTALIYIGDGETSDRAINLVGSTGMKRLDASGTGALVLNGPITNSATGAFTLELRGYNAEANTITSDLVNGGGNLAVTKTDGGTWVLTGNNTFSGNLTLASGNLGFTHSDALGSTSAGTIIFSNAGLYAVGGAQTVTRAVQFNNNTAAIFTGEHAISVGTVGNPVNVTGANGTSGSVWNLNNTITDPAGLTFNGDFVNADANNSVTRTLVFQGTGATTWNGVIQTNLNGTARQTGVTLATANSGSLTLAGDTPNTFDGPMTLTQGTLILAKDGALGVGTFAFNGGQLRTTLGGGATITNAVALNSGNEATVSGSESITFAGPISMGGSRNLVNELAAGQKLIIAGAITNTATSAPTLTLSGAGNTDITGSIESGTSAQNVAYSGRGTLALLGDNTTTGALTVNRGLVTLSGTGTNGRLNSASTISINGPGVLRLDNTGGNATGGRIDGRNVTISGGTLEFVGHAAGSSETGGNLTVNGFAGKILMSGGGPSTLTFGTLAVGSTGSFLDLGAVTDLGGANKILFTTAPAQANGIITKVGVGGADFATYDAANGLVAFTNYNTSNNLLTALPTDTMRITTSVVVPGSRPLNALAIDGDGLTVSGGVTGRTLTLTSGGLLVTGGDNTISVPILAFGTTAVTQIDDGASLEITGAMTGGSGLAKTLGGTLIISGDSFVTSTQNVSDGTLVLNNGLNTLYQGQLLSMGGPGTVLDLNGNSQFFAQLQTIGNTPNAGGTITSTGGPAVLLSNATSSTTFAGRIRGDITFSRVGGSTLTLETDQDYTGATILAGGTTTLRDDAQLSATSAIELNYGTLILNNNANLQVTLEDQVNDAAAITMRGGTLNFIGRNTSHSTETFGALLLDQGANTVTVTTGNSGAYFSADATFASLTRALGTTVNFTTGANALGAVGNNPHILFSSSPAVVGDGILGAWAIANSNDYAAYNQTNGVGPMNLGGFAAYETTFASGHITNIGANAVTDPLTTMLDGNTVTGMLRIAGGVDHAVVFANDSDVLNLELGGLLRSNNNNAASLGEMFQRGVLTAGGNALSGNSELIVYNNQNTLSIHSTIVDTQTATGTGTGTISLIKSGNGTVALTGANTYTGGTTVNQGTLRLENESGEIVLPAGGLTLNGGTVTMVNNSGQIDETNVVTLNGTSTLNLVGNNTLDSLVFNNIGGSGTPTVNTDGVLFLTNENAITVTSNDPSAVPTINGALDFEGLTRTLNVGAIQVAGQTISTLTPSLNIAATIDGFDAGIIKTGEGLLELSGQSTFSRGVDVMTGGLVIGANSTPTAGNFLTTGPLGQGTLRMAVGTSLFVDNASRTVANAVDFAGDAIFNNIATSTVNMTLNGATTLVAGDVKMTVVTPNLTTILGGVIGASATNIIKEGLGTLVLGNSANAFTGKITVNGGTLSISDDGALGVLPGAVLADAITLNNGGAFGSSANADLNANRGITLNGGGALSPNTNTILTIVGTIAGDGGLSMIGNGLAILAGNNTFTGGITVSSGTLLLAGMNAIDDTVYVLPGGTLALANDNSGLNGQALIVNSGSVGLFWDGDGRGTLENYVFPTVTPPANFIGDFGLAVNRIGTTAANKTIRYSLSDLPVITDQTVTVTNTNGYGLELMGDLTLGGGGGTPTFAVTTATGSNVVQGLTLNGQISGTSGFNKLGNGTIVLGNAANNFVGDININQGVVSVSANGQLGAATNAVVLSPTTGTATFRATDDLTFDTRVLRLGNTTSTRAIEVVHDKTLTLNTAFDLNGGAGAAANLTKADGGTLILNADNSGWSGNLTISGGAVRLNNSNAAGSGTIAIATTFGSALQLGGVTLGNTINLQTSNNSVYGGIQYGGSVQAVAGVNNLDGTLNITFDTLLSADAGATLNINGPIVAGTTLRQIIFSGAGDIKISSVLPRFHTLNKTGSGTLTITSANDETTSSGGLRVQSGELVLRDGGTFTGASQGIIVASGGALSLVDTGTPVVNRLGGKNLTVTGGIFNYTVSDVAASAETIGVLNFGTGQGTFNLINTGAQSSTLTFASLTLSAGSAVNFNGTFGGANKVIFTTAPVMIPAGAGILARALVNGTDFATYNATTGLTAFADYNFSNDLDGSQATDVMSVSANTATTSSRTLAGLKFDGSNIAVGGASGTVLTLTSGGVLVSGNNNTLDVPVLTLGTEGIFHVVDGASLAVNSAITGTAGMNKAGGGTLTLNESNFVTGTTYVSEGTLVLDGGTNTLNANGILSLGLEATLDLRGNTQYVNTLLSTGSGVTHNGGTAAATLGGIITSTAGPATFVTNMGPSGTFAGQITGAVTLGKAGGGTLSLSHDNTYTGKTILNGGTTQLLGDGRISGTSAIEINGATLILHNQVNLYHGDRLNDSAAITLNSGTLSFLGRALTNSTETVGAVTLGRGLSTINAGLGGTGINSAKLTLTDFLRSDTDSLVNFTGTNLGLIGSTSQIKIASFASNVDFLGPWAIANGTEYAAYDVNYGVGALNATGFPGYDGSSLAATNQATDNIRLTTGDYTVSSDTEINTLNLNGNVNLSFDFNGGANRFNILNLGGGGLLKSGAFGNTIGNNPGEGILTAGGSSDADFYIYNQQETLTIFSSIRDNSGGAVRLIMGNGGTIRLAGFNSYTGGTVINGGSVTIDNLLPNGGVTVNNGSLSTGFGNGVNSGIGSSNVITLNAGVLTLAGNNTLAGLNLNSNGATLTQVNTGDVLLLTGGITATPTSVAQIATINGTLDFGGVARTIDVDLTRVDGVDVAPYQAGLNITANIDNGGIIKTGAGVLQLSATASTFSGGVDLQSGSLIIGASSIPAVGGAPMVSGPLGTGTLTVSAGTTLLSTGNFSIANEVIINGDFTFAGLTNLQLNGPITLNQTIGDPAQIDITVVHPVMTATLGGPITGTVTNINKLGLGTLVVNPNYSGTITSGGGALSLLTDGDGTSSRETIQFGGITLTGPTTLNVGRLGTERSPLFTLAANKTIRINNVVTNGNALTVNNPSGGTGAGNGGYGLEIAGPVTLNVDQTYIVTAATASDVVQGLTLSGVVSGPGGIVKRGNGTLVLGSDANTFGGAGKLVDIQTGVVSVATDGALGDDANIVRFSSTISTGLGNTGLSSTTITVSSTAGLVVGASVFGANIPAEAVITAISGATTFVISAPATAAAVGTALTFANPTTLRVTESFATNRIFQFVAEAGSGEMGAEATFGVEDGKTLTLNSAFDLSLNAAGNIAKGNNGTLVLNAANSGWDGVLTIYGGAVQVGTANALGSTVGGVVVRSTEAALQLINGVTLADNLTLFGTGFDSAGALQGRGAVTNTASGTITLGATASIGADAGSTLNLTGGITGAQALTFASEGDINIRTTALGAVSSVTTFGEGTTALEVASPSFTGTLTISDGDFVIREGGTTGGSGTITLVSAGRLVIDNSATNIVDRFGSGARRNVTSIDGSIVFIGNDSAVSSETFGTLTLGSRGQTTITLDAGATGQANLRFNTVTRNERSTLRIESDSLSATAGAGLATLNFGTGAPTAGTGANGTRTKTILPWAVVHDTGTDAYSFAAFDGGFVRALGGLASGEVVGTLTSGANVQLSGAAATTGSIGFNSLTLEDGAALAINGRTNLTLGTSNSIGGILALPGNSTIGGNANGTGVITTGNNAELVIHTVGDLAISSTIGTSSGGMSKNGLGTLTLNQAVIRTGNFGINQGTVKLNGGTNTLWFNQNVMVNDGGVLDLFGNAQHFAILLTDGAAVANGGGIITNSHLTDQATLVVNNDNAARNWTGSITNDISFLRAGQNTLSFYSDNDYTGITQLSGGTTLLRDEGRLSKTTAIDINYAALTINNTGTVNMNDRVNDAATITLRGGNLTLQGRTQTNSLETVGDVVLAEGYSNILATAGGTGVNSAELTLASLVQGSTDAVVNFNGTGGAGQLGQIGSNPRILITDAPVLVNNIIGGWAIINGQEFASYHSDFGVGSLTQTGFAGYEIPLAGTVPETLLATDNVRATASFSVPETGMLINSLSLRGTFDTNFLSPDAVLNIVSGGLIANRSNSRLGSTADTGRLTAGGLQSSGTANLYLYNTANTYTVNARIIDNPNGANVRLVLSALGGALTLTDPLNSYTGGTVVNGGTVNLVGDFEGFGAVIPLGTDGLTINGATVTMQNFAQQIDAGNVVTLNGSSILNLIGDNTLAGIVFNTSGTGTGVITPTVNTGTDGTGVLTLTGDVFSNPSTVTTTATLFGRVDFGATARTINVQPIMFNGEDVSPLLAGLSIQGVVNSTGGFIKAGAGVLELDGQTIYSGATLVNEGTIQIGSFFGGSRFSDYSIASGARLNLNGQSTSLGSLAGAGTVTNSGSAQTLTVGHNGSSTTFSGQFDRYSDAVLNAVNVAKIGTGRWTLTGNAGANYSSGTLSVNEGEVAYDGGGTAALTTHLVQDGGTLILENSVTNTNDRLAGTTLNISGGLVQIRGNAAAATTESVNTLTIGGGTGTLLLDPAGQALTFTANAISGLQAGGTLVLRSLPGASFQVTSLNQPGGQGNGLDDTTNKLIRPDIIGDTSGHALADLDGTTAFVTRDSDTSELRPLSAAEMETVLTNSSTTNFTLNAAADFEGNLSANSLRLENGVTLTSVAPGTGLPTTVSPGGLTTLSLTTGGLLALGGDSTLNFGLLSTPNNVPAYFYTLGATTSVTVNAFVGNSSGGMIKAGDGMLTLNKAAFYSGTTAINGGVMVLNGGENTIRVLAGPTAATLSALQANDGLLDLNGNSQAFGTLSSNNPLPNTGATITNSVVGSPINLVTSNTGTSTFSGQINGNLNFIKSGNSTLTLTSANSYTGETIVRANTVVLQDEGSLLNTSAVSLLFGNLTIDNRGLGAVDAPNPQRLPDNVPLTIRDGTLTLIGAGSSQSAFSFGDVTIGQGAATINLAPAVNSGANSILVINNLLREMGATVHFTSSTSTGTLGDSGYNGAQIFLNQINGFAPVDGGFLGSWAVVNSGDFAVYLSGRGVSRYGQAGFPGYGTTFASGVINNLNGNATLGTAGTPGTILVGALRITGGTTRTVSFANATDVLNIETGGLLSSNENNARVIGATDTRGILTAGGSASSGVVELVVGKNQNTVTIHSVITDNGVGASLSLVKTLAGALTLTAENTYTGATVVDQGTLNLSASTAGSVVVPGDLAINNATVTMNTHAQQIATTSNVTLSGGGALNLEGANTLNSITWNDLGGTSNPTVNTDGALTLTSTNGLTAFNDNFATTPILAGSWNLGADIVQTVTTGGTAPTSLQISAAITGTGTSGLTKEGVGALLLSNNGGNDWLGNTTINGGTLRLGSVNPLPTTAALVINAGGVLDVNGQNMTSATGSLTGTGKITNEANSTATLFFGGDNADATFSGTITNVPTNALSIIKTGTGTQTLTGGNNSYTGTTAVRDGRLVLGAENVISAYGALILGNNLTGANSTQGIVDMQNFSQTAGGLTVQSDSATANEILIGAGQTLTVTGNVLIGENIVQTPAAPTTTLLAVTGQGTLTVNNDSAGALFGVGAYTSGTAGNGSIATADFSGLSTLNILLNTTNGTVRVSNTSGGNTTNVFSKMILAETSTITAANLLIGGGGQFNNGADQINSLRLGSGVNTLNVNTISLGIGGRDYGALVFDDVTGSLIVRDASGTGRATLEIANAGGTGTGTTGGTNTFDVTGHDADLLLGAVTVGAQNRGANSLNVFSFDQGTLDMTSLTAAVRSAQPGAGTVRTTTSTINLGGGIVNIAEGILNLAQVTGTATQGTVNGIVNISGGDVTIGATAGTAVTMASATMGTAANATLNFTGGTTTADGDILRGGGLGTTSASLNLNGGSLDMTGHSIGGTDAIALTLASGTLRNVAQINNGGVFSKTTTGTLHLEGTNTYTGGTAVDDGTLVVAGSLSGTANVNVGGGVNPAVLTAVGTLTSPTFDVQNGGTLNGTGTLHGAVTVETGGALAPGAGLSSLTISTGSLAFEADSTFALSLANTNGSAQPLNSDYSKLTLGTGIAADLNGTIVTNVSGALNGNDLFTVILSGTAVNGIFTNTTQVSGSTYAFSSSGYDFLINYAFDGASFDGSVGSFQGISGGTNVAVLVVPEPNALTMLAGSLGLALGLQRFRRRRAAALS